MLHVDTLKRLLAITDVARDPYAVADASAAMLAAAPTDSVLRIHYARALAALGLGSASRRVLAGAPGVPEPLRAQIAAVPDGTSPWSSRSRRFRANLAALCTRWPDCQFLATEWDAHAARFELHMASDGNAFILDTTLPIWSGWLGGGEAGTLENHKASIAAWQYDKTKVPMLSPVAFDGIGYGWFVPHVMQTTANTFLQYSCAIHIVEPDPLALCMAMHIQDLQTVFSSPRVHVYAGPGAAERFRATFDDRSKSIPGPIVTQLLTRREPLRLAQACDTLNATRAAARAKLKAEIDAYYADKDAAYWAARYAEAASGGPPLRVVGLTTRYSTVLRYSMEEMRRAVLAAGCHMQLAIEPDDSSVENPNLDLIASFKPDMIFQISRMRYENPHLPANVPFVCWDQDNLPCMRTPAATASLSPLTYVAGHGANFGYSHLNWPRQNVILCHPAGATFRYSAEPVPGRDRYACDVSYVSNASEPPSALRSRFVEKWSRSPLANAFSTSIERVLHESAAGRTWDFRALWELAAAAASSPLAEPTHREFTLDLNTFADRCFRHTALDWVSRWCAARSKTLRIYGAGWENHPALSAHAAGPAQQGDELRAIYQASRINLQLIEPGFIHSRSLDGIAAGGFFMTRLTLADGVGSDVVAAVYRLARWCAEHRITTREQIENTADPLARALWPVVREYFREHNVDWVLMRCLETWAELPPACEAIPHLPDVTFSNEDEFARLADRFLADDALRLSIAGDMRRAVVDRFSYSARFTAFLDTVRAGLAPAAQTASTLEPAGAS